MPSTVNSVSAKENHRYQKWEYPDYEGEELEKISEAMGYSNIASQIILQRIGPDREAIQSWVSPRLSEILDPKDLYHCPRAAKQLSDAILHGQTIGIFSDYDVDGITSAALATQLIKALDGVSFTFIPDRLNEGYGLTKSALDRLLSNEKPDLLLILDCGTRSEDELSYLSSIHIPTIVVDHHAATDFPNLPDDCILINPHLQNQVQSEFQTHCTAGLIFKLLHATIREHELVSSGARDRIDLKSLLDLVALGTVADLVPLTGENRIFVHHGLNRLRTTENCGLKALMQVADIDPAFPISPSDVGYRLGPRINAGGRIDDAEIGLELLTTQDNRLAFALARKLDGVNADRRALEKRVIDEALDKIGETPADGIVVWDEDWHPGVVGIVAGRLSRMFHRPCLVLGWDGQILKGSGRGIEGINLLQVMERCAVSPTKWGGHPMALGMSIEPSFVEAFSDAFSQAVKEVCNGALPARVLRLNAIAEAESVDRQTILEIESIGPFGQGNEEPIIGLRQVVINVVPRPFGKEHIRFSLEDHGYLEVIGWRMADRSPPVGKPIDLAVRLKRNWWKGRESIRAELEDWRLSVHD
ncbi:MAG: single-stranded-DNA-specific exonuclease RecJ [Verrucomicrobiota bacterium]